MEHPEIAKIILDRRNGLSFNVLGGEIREQLGADGYAEALHQGWLLPDYDTGLLTVTTVKDKLNYLAQVYEFYQPGGKRPEDSTPVDVGDPVGVSADGRFYPGRVSKRNQDGTYDVSFDNTNKPRQLRPFRSNELRRMARGNKAQGAPAGAAPAVR